MLQAVKIVVCYAFFLLNYGIHQVCKHKNVAFYSTRYAHTV